MSAFSELLSTVKVSGTVYFCDKLSVPWVLDVPKEHSSVFHYVRQGQLWLEFGDQKHLVNAGDLIFIGQGAEHRMHDVYQGAQDLSAAAPTHLLCGYFEFLSDVLSPFTGALPECFIIPEEQLNQMQWLHHTLQHLGAEYQAGVPGATVVINKLSEILLVEVLRSYRAQNQDEGYLAALFDPQISRALDLIHQAPHKPWTMDELAQVCAMSRAVFAKRFKSLVGETMFHYLSQVRMQKASELLITCARPVADIAEDVGYQSELAFTRVFKKQYEMTPTAWRKSKRIL